MIMNDSRFFEGEHVVRSSDHTKSLLELRNFMQNSPALDGAHWNRNLLTFLSPATLSRAIYLSEIYRRVLEIPGVVIEAGVLYGSTTLSLSNLRSIYEPFNHTRRIIAFDTFTGFPKVSGSDPVEVKVGDYSTTKGWETTLEKILQLNEQVSPLSHLKKYEIIKGDITKTLPQWLDENPGVTVALLHLDLDLFEPTLAVLEALEARFVRGTIVAFDEFSDESWPGETMAFLEKFPLKFRNIRRSTLQNNCAYLVID
jgi:hypothetical protein